MKKRSIARFIAFAVFVACAVYLGIYAYNAKYNSDSAEKRAETASKFSGGSGTNEIVTAVDASTGEEKHLMVLGQYEKLYGLNKNLAGWLKIPGTNVDYPVMKNINGKGDYYLNHNFNGEERAVPVLFPVEIMIQIKLTVSVNRLHHRVIDICIVYLYPARKVLILLIEFLVLPEDHELTLFSG